MFVRLKNIFIAAIAGSILVGAAGCTPEAETAEPTGATQSESPAPTSTKPTPSPTPKPTSTPVPGSSKGPAQNWPVPVMPAVAKEKSEVGVVAFTEYWFELIEYMYRTNDTTQVKKVTSPECDICAQKFIDPADGLAKNSAWTTGGELDVSVTLAVVKEKSGVANFRLKQKDLLVYDADGVFFGKLPGTVDPDVGTLGLLYDEGWHVTELKWLESK